MHAVSHSLSHRGPSASRTRARWQPYASIPPPSVRSPSSAYFNTPATTVSTSLQQPVCEPQQSKPPLSSQLSHSILPQPHKDAREVHKLKYVNGLVDVAVKSLCEIWQPHDIPAVFSTPTCLMATTSSLSSPSANGLPNVLPLSSRYTQLPSPPNSPLPHLQPVATSDGAPLTRAATIANLASIDPARNKSAPLKSFVHEVLRRSRTSCSVLQTALCYLEAIRHKVPELMQQEQAGEGIRGEADQGSRIIPQDDPRAHEPVEQVDMSELIDASRFVNPESFYSDITPPTVRVLDDNPLAASETSSWLPTRPGEKKPRGSIADLSPLPPLPSPLLCPRRAFLASLILASKFMQDKCYSNKAWAKLAGLPAREIGRCERALGEALEWRLWVGKMPAQRTPTRSQSTGSLFARSDESLAACDFVSGSTPTHTKPSIRRSSTLPADAFQTRTSTDAKTIFPPVPIHPVGFTVPFAAQMQGPWMPLPPPTPSLSGRPSTAGSESSSASDYSPTPTLTTSPATTDASSDSLCEERTIQMNSYIDDVNMKDIDSPIGAFESGPLLYKVQAPAGVHPTFLMEGEGGIARAWDGYAWNGAGTGSGWIRGEALS